MINIFTEKEIREKILSKVNPVIENKDSKHWIGLVYVNEVIITKVKIPNSHKRDMFMNKSKHIAKDLKLSHNEFNDLIKCKLSGKEYYKIINPKS